MLLSADSFDQMGDGPTNTGGNSDNVDRQVEISIDGKVHNADGSVEHADGMVVRESAATASFAETPDKEASLIQKDMLDNVFETDFDNNSYFKNMDKDLSSQKDFKKLNKDPKEFNEKELDILPEAKPVNHVEKKPKTRKHKKKAKKAKKVKALAETQGVGVSKELGNAPTAAEGGEEKPLVAKTKREKEQAQDFDNWMNSGDKSQGNVNIAQKNGVGVSKELSGPPVPKPKAKIPSSSSSDDTDDKSYDSKTAADDKRTIENENDFKNWENSGKASQGNINMATRFGFKKMKQESNVTIDSQGNVNIAQKKHHHHKKHHHAKK